MLLWVGLGNPEPGMRGHRHNVGFMAIDRVAEAYRFTPWRQRFRGLTAEGSVGGERVLALKPMTYMNLSGDSVQAAAAFYKLPVEAITVFYDDLDLAPGKVRVKQGGSAAGHNGLRSMDKMLPSPAYWRVRIGIGHPGHKDRVTGHVLGDFSKQDQMWLPGTLDALATAAPLLAEAKPEAFMTKVALITQAQDAP